MTKDTFKKEIEAIRAHIAVLNDHSGELADDQKEITRKMSDIRMNVGKLSTDMDWLKKSYWLVAGASVGALLTSLVGVLLNR